jgi:biotin-dependent carboxylase-like uncharacterized protein
MGGAMDRFALCAANRLLGNPPNAAVIEITAGGAAFTLLRPLLLALTGANLGATWNDRPLPLWTAIVARTGDQIALPGRTANWGARAYLAMPGGVDVPLVLGSRSTYLPSRFGGMDGRKLQPGDTLAAAQPDNHWPQLAGRCWPLADRPGYSPSPTLRFLPGPHQHLFAPGTIETVASVVLHVSAAANRMGYRLDGADLDVPPLSLPSLGVIPGAIQVPPNGQPILLMADAQTTGGYPILGVVIAADLPLAAQLLPGDTLRLAPITETEALAARRSFAAWCAAPIPTDPTFDLLALAGTLPWQ